MTKKRFFILSIYSLFIMCGMSFLCAQGVQGASTSSPEYVPQNSGETEQTQGPESGQNLFDQTDEVGKPFLPSDEQENEVDVLEPHVAEQLRRSLKKTDVKSDIHLRVALGLFYAWNKLFEIYRYDKENSSDGAKISKGEEFADQMVRIAGGATATLEKVDDFAKKGYFGQQGKSLAENLGIAASVALNEPLFLHRFYHIASTSYRYPAHFYEQEFGLATQALLRFMPALLHHSWKKQIMPFWNSKYKDKGYTTFGPTFAAGTIAQTLSSASGEEGDGGALDKNAVKRGYTSVVEYEAQKKCGTTERSALEKIAKNVSGNPSQKKLTEKSLSFKAFIPGTKAWAAADALEFQQIGRENKGKWKVPGAAKGKSWDIVDSRLYRNAFVHAAQLFFTQAAQRMSEKLEGRYSKAELDKLNERTYGIVSPALLLTMCSSLAHVMVYGASQAVHEKMEDGVIKNTLAQVVPQFTKLDLSIADTRKIRFITDSESTRKEKDLYVYRESSCAKYLAKQVVHGATRNFGAHAFPRLLNKCRDNRKELADWIHQKIRSLGSVFVKYGLSEKNPIDSLTNVLHRHFLSLARSNPELLCSALKIKCGHYRGDGSFIAQFQLMINPKLDVYWSTFKKLKEIIESKMELHEMSVRYLITRDDERYKKRQKLIDERMDEVIAAVEKHSLLTDLGDDAFMIIYRYLEPRFPIWGADIASSFIETVERKVDQALAEKDPLPDEEKKPAQPVKKPEVNDPRPDFPIHSGPNGSHAGARENDKQQTNWSGTALGVCAGAVTLYGIKKLWDRSQQKIDPVRRELIKKYAEIIKKLKIMYNDYKAGKIAFKDYNAMEDELLKDVDEGDHIAVKKEIYLAA